MSEDQQNRSIPRIEGAVDLVHLNPGQRLHLLGKQRFLERRTFLKNLLGASAIIAVPPFLAGCGDEGDDGEDGEGCTCQSDSACACQSDGGDTDEDTATACDDATLPTVISIRLSGTTIPIFGVVEEDYLFDFPTDRYTVDISISFSRGMTVGDSIAEGGNEFPWLTISPSPSTGVQPKTYNGRDVFFNDTVTGHTLTLSEETRYTLTVSGSATDICGNRLNGNFDGNGGTDFVFSFVTGTMAEDTCTCQSDSCPCQSDSCSCQSDSCICQSFDCSCQFEGCPTYGIY